MSKRIATSRGASPQRHSGASRIAAGEPANPHAAFLDRGPQRPRLRHYVWLILAAVAFISWLVVLAVMAYL